MSQKWRKDPKPTCCLLVGFSQIYSDKNVWLLDFSRRNRFHNIPKLLILMLKNLLLEDIG